MLQCVAVCCNVLQLCHICDAAAVYELLCIAVCCSVLRCVAVCCRMLQFCHMCDAEVVYELLCIAVCCVVLQCVALCCSVLTCVAEWFVVCVPHVDDVLWLACVGGVRKRDREST